jgi:hypothetical protein
MLRELIAVSMSALVVSATSTAVGADVNDRAIADIKQEVGRIQGAGTLVEVKFLQKDREKLTGRLGSVTETGFEIQPGKDGQGVAQTISFSEVKSVKQKTGMHPAAKAGLITGVIVGGLALTFGILCGIGYCSQ